LSSRLGRSPRVGELAAELGVPEETVIEALDARAAYRPTSLATPTGQDEGRTLEDALGADDRGYAQAEARLTVDRLLEELPPRERRILELRYFEELSQDEIAGQIGISQMHVSRLLRRVTELLAAGGEEQHVEPRR
jgi:RNA polymerase sigma-B factor